MNRKYSLMVVRGLAGLVTIWLLSHTLYIVDETYRTSLRLAWKAKHGTTNYTVVLTPGRMREIHHSKKKDYLDNHHANSGPRPWKQVEDDLERSLQGMFERTDPMKGWELKKIGNAAWQDAYRYLKSLKRIKDATNPLVKVKAHQEVGVDMSRILIYNRIPKSGSTFLLSLLYQLGKSLGFLVLRGKYHSYRYFLKNDREGLGHFLEQASTRAKTAYVQHQYYVNYTQFHQQQPVYINIMRDPVEHLISSYYYKRTVILQHRGPEDMSPEERRIMEQPLEECVIERRLECVYYGYTVHRNKTEQLDFRKNWSANYLYPSDVLLYFCGHEEECTQLGNPLALQRAKYNVDKHFAVVGILEHLNETLAVLESQLPQFFSGLTGLAAPDTVKNRNQLKAKNVPAEVRKVLQERLAPEYDLYNHVKQKLFRQFHSRRRPSL